MATRRSVRRWTTVGHFTSQCWADLMSLLIFEFSTICQSSNNIYTKNVLLIFLKQKVVRLHQQWHIFWAIDTKNTSTSVHSIRKKNKRAMGQWFQWSQLHFWKEGHENRYCRQTYLYDIYWCSYVNCCNAVQANMEFGSLSLHMLTSLLSNRILYISLEKDLCPFIYTFFIMYTYTRGYQKVRGLSL